MATVVITGAGDGIGASAARQLTAAGQRVVLVGRSARKTDAVARELDAPCHVADFAELDQVRRLAAELRSAYPRIDVLANNADGVFDRATTVDGHDRILQVNHLAPFLLTTLLLDRLIDSGASVIATSSTGAKTFGHLDLDDLGNARRWSAAKAYGDSKLANILITRELHRRFHDPAADQGLHSVAFHPGNVATNFANETRSWFRLVFRTPLARLVLVRPEAGGRALSRLVEGTPGTTWQSGGYYQADRLVPVARLNPQVADLDLARGLWERSAELVAG